MSPCSPSGTPSCMRGSPNGAQIRSRTKARKSPPVTAWMMSARTQCADDGWYADAVPGSQLRRHSA